ncbi:O-antigen ligase family protein [Phenylobacterium sp.]|uniref:O-antigen ligase family protein n=1 Tax=Phenylobacterium sp. TaxID=1871053 RepID=UPI0039512A1B
MSGGGARATERAGGADGLWPPPPRAWAPAAALLVIQAAHLAYGAVVGDAALAMDLAAATILGAILLTPALREDLLRLTGLEIAGALFLAVLAAGAWSLTPWVPGGPHPVWTYVGLRGGATVDRSATIVELVKLMGLACFFLIGAAAGARDERARFAVRITVLAGALFGLWAIFAGASGAIYQTQGRRLEALFLNPNTAGNLFAALFILAVAAFWRPARRREAGAYLLGTAGFVLAVTVLNTGSRGAVLAALVGLLTLFGLRFATGGVKPGRAFAAGLAGVVLLAVLVALAGDRVVARFFRTEVDSPLRYAIWDIHWRAFLESPFLGYGLGGFEPVNRSLLTGADFATLANLRAPLNLYLQWLEEGGLFAAVPMFLCVAAIMLGVLRGLLRRSRMTALLAGLLAMDVVFIVHGLTDSALQSPSIAAFWAWTLGLQAALAQGSSRR